MKNLTLKTSLLLLAFGSLPLAAPIASASEFSLTSSDIHQGKPMPKQQEYEGFGCHGGNTSPELSWSNAPKGTQSFAITAYDPDAPTGSGWWHWQIVNIPKNVHSLKVNAGNPKLKLAPKGSLQIQNDYGQSGFGGACPPKGDKAHHYQFTVYALKVAKLPLKANSSGALAGYMIKGNALASATLEALYQR